MTYFYEIFTKKDTRRFCEFCKKKNSDLVRVRTEDLTVNSRALCQLSYKVEEGANPPSMFP